MTPTIITDEMKSRLLDAAHEAMVRAYAPYSKFLVGAAVLTADGQMHLGCNVENVSYGLTICAERTAICNAVAASRVKPQEKIRIAAVAVVNSAEQPCSPCGACRQFIAEFASPETVIFYQGAQGITQMTMQQLLPDCFTF